MATKKKPSKKVIRKKVTKLMESDIFHSVAIVSVLLNILFLVSIFVLTSTDTFDRKFYNSAKSRYCANVQGIEDRAEELGSEAAAVREWQITCVSKEYKPFYNESVEKFNAQYQE
ncbi:hypothetical protein KC973_00410 [Candidatus Saccharibacteria bacterium]|nr:hypothetical protein [Candidatus Saccharibacteria bacterium]